MSNLKFSIVVCTFNRSESLQRTLRSLQDMVVPDHLSYEIIVVDNNSDDNTRLMVGEAQTNPELNLKYVLEEKRGLSHARNRGIKEAAGEIVVFTDDDVLVDRQWIQSINTAFAEHDGVACVGGKVLPIWEVQKPEWLKPDLYGYLALLDKGNSVAYMNALDIWGANFAVKSEMFRKFGLFDTSLGRMPRKLYSGEEAEFLQRLQKAGEEIIYCPFSIIHHFVPVSRMSKKYLCRWRFDQGELEGMLTDDVKYSGIVNYHSRTKVITLFGHVVASLLKIGCFTEDRFNHELRIWHILGFMAGRMRRLRRSLVLKYDPRVRR